MEKIQLTGKLIKGGKALRMDIDGNIINATIELSPPVLQNLKEGSEVLVKCKIGHASWKAHSPNHFKIEGPSIVWENEICVEDKDIVAILSKKEEQQYPCADCGKLRTKAEGGTTFTVCDKCWDKKYKKTQPKLMPKVPEKIQVNKPEGFLQAFSELSICVKDLQERIIKKEG